VKTPSLRLKFAVAVSVLASGIVILFAVLSAEWFYQEQLDAEHEARGIALTPKQIADVQGDVGELVGVYLIALPLAALAVAAGAWMMAGWLTNPLARLAAAAQRIDAHTLSERLPERRESDEIARLTRVLNDLIERLELSFSQARRFSADASHELRTPLAIMRARLEIALQADPSGQQAAFFVTLLDDAHRLATILEKLLLLAKADAGKLLTATETVNMSAILAGIVEDFSGVAAGREVQLAGPITPGLQVRGDAGLLQLLFINLFDNALKYNCSGGRIDVVLERRGDRMEFTIRNTGPAIPKDLQPRLFERFFRADESRDRESGGTGLGLNLAREIALAHGGQLDCLFSAERGTAFRVVLPMFDGLKAARSPG